MFSNAAQQCDLFLNKLKKKGNVPPEKATNIRYCYIIGEKMNKLTQEELNGLSPRAKKST